MTKTLYQPRQKRAPTPTLPPCISDALWVRIISQYIPIEMILEKKLHLVRNLKLHYDILKYAIVFQEMTFPVRQKFWLHFCARTDEILADEQIKLRGFTRERVYLYYLRAARSEESEAEIERDVVRTMPNHFLFSSSSPIGAINRGKLKSVLFAISSAEPNVGYCQGMNFVVATLLIHLQMDESDAFFMFISILRDYHYKYIYSPEVPQLPLRLFHFSRVVRAHVPSVWHHLNAKTFSVEIFANQWIMTLYAYYLGPDVLPKIWSLFFLLGWEYLFQLGATILSLLEPQITEMDVEEISAFMQRKNQQHPFSQNLDSELLLSITKFPVSTNDLETYTQQFLTEKLLQVISETKRKKSFTQPPRIMGFSFTNSQDTLFSGQSSPSDLSPSESKFLRIDLSCFATANRPHELPVRDKIRLVNIPIQSVTEISASVDFVAASFAKETARISAELENIEKARLAMGKQFNALLNQVSRSDESMKKIMKRKFALSNALRTSVESTHSPLISPVGSDSEEKSSRIPKSVTDLLSLVTEAETEFATKKAIRDKLNMEVQAIESRIQSLLKTKEVTIIQLSQKVVESENVQNDIVYRCIQSAIDSFA